MKKTREAKQIKSATSACCLLLLSPAEIRGKALGDGGGHAELMSTSGLPCARRAVTARFHSEPWRAALDKIANGSELCKVRALISEHRLGGEDLPSGPLLPFEDPPF